MAQIHLRVYTTPTACLVELDIDNLLAGVGKRVQKV